MSSFLGIPSEQLSEQKLGGRARPFKRIGIMTSGGDAPGMNTALRATTRAALHHGLEVIGIERGYVGMLKQCFRPLTAHDVGNIMQRGGTVLGTARSERFKTEEGRKVALDHLHAVGIEAVVIIGGNGSLAGGLELEKLGMPVVGIPGSIDNDLYGTNMAIGVDTCLNTIIEAVDKIKDTAASHQRAFVVEVMGRHSGYLALMSALASGAEMAVIPEVETSLDEIGHKMIRAFERGKNHFIVMVAEGAALKTSVIYDQLAKFDNFETRITILGHLQRGGAPSAYDRILASYLGGEAVECLLAGQSGVMVGQLDGKLTRTPLEQVVKRTSAVNLKVHQLIQLLS